MYTYLSEQYNSALNIIYVQLSHIGFIYLFHEKPLSLGYIMVEELDSFL